MPGLTYYKICAPNGRKMFQMAIKAQILSIPRHSKVFPNWLPNFIGTTYQTREIISNDERYAKHPFIKYVYQMAVKIHTPKHIQIVILI
jgi:hypothetical protein